MPVTRINIEVEASCDHCGTPIKATREQGKLDFDVERYGVLYALGMRAVCGEDKVYCCEECKDEAAKKKAEVIANGLIFTGKKNVS